MKVARLVERHRIEKHYREIVEQAADIIYTRDMDGYITSINDAGARFYGVCRAGDDWQAPVRISSMRSPRPATLHKPEFTTATYRFDLLTA